MIIKRIIGILLVIISSSSFSQTDYSNEWEDFYSYTNVKDFYFGDDTIYAVCDNAIFIYDTNTLEYKKISSVHGLSGNVASSFLYNQSSGHIVIGYENGLVEVVNSNNSIQILDDISRLNITGSKKINHMIAYGNKIYLSTDFAIIEFDIDNFVFGDTFYIGDQSSTVSINQIAIFENTIYAATKNGIFTADVSNTNLIDFNNWEQPQGDFVGDFTAIKTFNNQLFASKDKTVYVVSTPTTLLEFYTYFSDVININSSEDYLNVSINTVAYTYDQSFYEIHRVESSIETPFNLHNSYAKDNTIFLATKGNGILKQDFNSIDFEEIHPDGPLENDVFAIEVANNHLWVVYGGQDISTYNSSNYRKGFSHYNGKNWVNTPYDIGIGFDLLDITIDVNHENKVYISSWRGGLLEVVDDELIIRYDYLNSGLDRRPVTWANMTCVSSSDLDSQGNLWVANGYVLDRLKKFDTVNSWEGYSFTEQITDNRKGLGDVMVDRSDNKWLEMRQNGLLVLHSNGTKKKVLNNLVGSGNLPSNTVYAFEADRNNRIWIGTNKGLVRFDDTSSLFESNNYNAKPIIIKLEGGTGEEQGQKLLGDQSILAIAIDGADNKWFGTENGGVLSTNSTGQKTLHIFDKNNSPLPSNQINKIKVDDSTGKVYFATPKGIVAFNNNVVPFGDTLDKTYAYPNPSTKENEFITIDGRHGTHLPARTNVKILDSAGYLVYETNVIEGVEEKGGKVIWNKKNLAGRKVASGVYIILLTLPDTSETSITKVAIIN